MFFTLYHLSPDFRKSTQIERGDGDGTASTGSKWINKTFIK